MSRNYAVKVGTDMKVQADTQAFPMKIAMTALMRETVKNVGSDGTATLETQILSANTDMNGKPMPMKNSLVGKRTTLKRTATGKVSGIKAPVTGVPGMGMDFGSMQVSATFPQGQVRPGSRWSGSTNMGSMGTVLMNYTLDRVGASGGSSLAYIHGTGTVDIGKLVGALMGKSLPGAQIAGGANLDIHIVFNVTSGTMQKTSEDAAIKMDMAFNNPQTGKPMKTHTSGTTTMSMDLRG